MRAALEIAFFVSLGLLVYQQLGYPLLLAAIRAVRRRRGPPPAFAKLPSVSLIVAANNEENVIAGRIANALAMDYPREKLELIVASDGSTDGTTAAARASGADLVLDLPRAGKVVAQNAAVERARGEILAFSDANTTWQPDALRELVAPFADPKVGYVCGQVRLIDQAAPMADDRNRTGGVERRSRRHTRGGNQEGLYWRFEMAVRQLESDLGGVTAGNGPIYAARASDYIVLDASRSHDGSFPFQMVKRGHRSLYAPDAVAEERMVPTIAGEFGRKRRIMRPLWDVVVLDGMLSPRGYPPLYAFQIYSNRLLRYLAPLLHLVALGTSAGLASESTFFAVALGAQLAFLAAAALAPIVPLAPFRIARYYVSVMASIVAGLWDRFRLGPRFSWEKAEGAREPG
jgi:cellulose synthase/poly-beta-1,6-N-acetylglucosamine synthase-like glycosyltransferase